MRERSRSPIEIHTTKRDSDNDGNDNERGGREMRLHGQENVIVWRAGKKLLDLADGSPPLLQWTCVDKFYVVSIDD